MVRGLLILGSVLVWFVVLGLLVFRLLVVCCLLVVVWFWCLSCLVLRLRCACLWVGFELVVVYYADCL